MVLANWVITCYLPPIKGTRSFLHWVDGRNPHKSQPWKVWWGADPTNGSGELRVVSTELLLARESLPCGFLTFWLKRGEPWQPPIWFKDTVDGSEIRRSPVEVRIPKPGSLKYGLYIVCRGIPWKNRLQSGFKLIEQHIFIASMSTIFYAYMQRLALCCRCRYRCCCCCGLCLMVMTMCWLCW